MATSRPRRPRAAAANELFAERGYDETTIDEIAARADVSRATAFNYSPSQEDFLYGVMHDRRRAVADLLAAEQDRRIPTAERLTHALMTLCDMLKTGGPRNRECLHRAHLKHA